MQFDPKRLIHIREKMGINKAEAARRLNMSAMGYGRYEKGEREPSFQTLSFIAETFGTTTDYLYGLSEDSCASVITISMNEEPELFLLAESLKHNRSLTKILLAYYQKHIETNKADN